MATLKGSTIASTYDLLLKRHETYVQGGTNIELMTDTSGATAPTGLYLESGATTDNVGIGVSDPDELLELYKVGTQLKLSGGAADYATFAVAADGALTITTVDVDAAEADIILAPDGNVGIGTSSPGRQLTVSSAQPELRLEGLGSVNRDWLLYVKGSDGSFQIYDEDATTERLVIDTSGNVGIGTDAPDAFLHLESNVTGISDAHIRLTDNADAREASIVCNAGDLILATHGTDNAPDGQIIVHEGGSIYFSTGSDGATDVTIDTSGNVGIGDTSPDAHLKVENLTVDTTDSYYGAYFNHKKTAGVTDASDLMMGLRANVGYDQTDGFFDEFYGGFFRAYSEDTSGGESGNMIGIYNNPWMDGNTDVAHMYGAIDFVNIDGGVVDGNVYGQYTLVDIDGGSLGTHILGNVLEMNTTVNPGGGVSGFKITMTGAGMDASGDQFLLFHDGQNDDTVAQITALDGVATFDSGDFSGAPDYAEYFESKDGNAIAVGTTVKLDGDKVVACSEGDTPIGVVRPDGVGTSAYKAGAQNLRWHGKYLYDDFNELQHEDYTIKQWSEEITFDEYVARGKDETGGSMGGHVKDEKVEGSKAIEAVEAVEAVESQDATYYEEGDELPEGKEVGDVKTEAVQGVEAVEAVEGVDEVPDTYRRRHSYHSDRIPDGITVPDDAETPTVHHKRKKLNPDYDASKHDDYKSRPDRDEWNLIGLLGQIPITKGQPLADNWIKMKDVSDTVEMYFVK